VSEWPPDLAAAVKNAQSREDREDGARLLAQGRPVVWPLARERFLGPVLRWRA
jgi:hypothetical protein